MNSNQADHLFLSGLTVLYVEHEVATQSRVEKFLDQLVGRLCVAADGLGGFELFRRERPDLLVCNLIGQESNSLALVKAIRAEAPGLPVILTTACEETHVFLRSLEIGVNRFLLKPLNTTLLEAALLHCAHDLRVARERAALQKQKLELLQAQHEETLGALAGGLAHDYNNLLQGVMANVYLAKQSRTHPNEVFHLLDAAESAWEEIRELGHRLGLLLQNRTLFQFAHNLEADLREALGDYLGASGCTLELYLPEDLPQVRFDREQMRAALSILASNAMEAMGGSGTLRVEGKVRRITLEEPVPVAPGDYLQLSFSDRGPGIAQAILPIMFSPYTSSKARGSQRGMGLSLALAQSIMKQHAGALLGENRTDGGATLYLLLPVPSLQEGPATGGTVQNRDSRTRFTELDSLCPATLVSNSMNASS